MPRTPAAPSNLSVVDGERLARVIEASVNVSRPLQCLLWLQGELQHFVPHRVLIVARGNFLTGELRYDVVAQPGVETRHFVPRETAPFLRRLYKLWIAYGRQPLALNSFEATDPDSPSDDIKLSPVMPNVGTVIAHVSKDDRRRRDCLCVAMHSERGLQSGPVAALEVLFPHIDSVLRRVSSDDKRRSRATRLAVGTLPESNLSPRELEILEWVGKGKTNHEIALILDISPYTVKNHLQHIFRKLDVLNRAQAVGKYAGESAGQLIRFSHG